MISIVRVTSEVIDGKKRSLLCEMLYLEYHVASHRPSQSFASHLFGYLARWHKGPRSDSPCRYMQICVVVWSTNDRGPVGQDFLEIS